MAKVSYKQCKELFQLPHQGLCYVEEGDTNTFDNRYVPAQSNKTSCEEVSGQGWVLPSDNYDDTIYQGTLGFITSNTSVSFCITLKQSTFAGYKCEQKLLETGADKATTDLYTGDQGVLWVRTTGVATPMAPPALNQLNLPPTLPPP